MNEIEKVEDEIPENAFSRQKSSRKVIDSARNRKKSSNINESTSRKLNDSKTSFNSKDNFAPGKRNFNKNKKDADKKSDPRDRNDLKKDGRSQNRGDNKENLRTPDKKPAKIAPYHVKRSAEKKSPDIKKSPYYQRERPPPDELLRFRDGLTKYSARKIPLQDHESRGSPSNLRESQIIDYKLDWKPSEYYMGLGNNIYERSTKISKENQLRRTELSLANYVQEISKCSFMPEILKSSKKMTEDKESFFTKTYKEIEELREKQLRKRDYELANPEGNYMTQDDKDFLKDKNTKSKSVMKMKPTDWDRMYKTSMRWLNNKDTLIKQKQGAQALNSIAVNRAKPELINSEFTDEIVINRRIKEQNQDMNVGDRLYKDAGKIKKYKEELTKEYDKLLLPFTPNVYKVD